MELKSLKYIYGGILLFLIIISIITYWNQENYNEEVNWVRHSNRVLRSLESLLSAVKDAETGHRGYQLTKDTSFLAPYHRSALSLEDDIHLLDSLLLGQTIQKVRKDSLKSLIGNQYRIIREIIINESKKDSLFTTYRYDLLLEGKLNMDKIRTLVTKMEKEEEKSLVNRVSSEQVFKRMTPITLLFYAIVALGGATFLFILLNQELHKRKVAEQELRIYTEDLKRSNEDLEQFAYVASHDLQEPLRKIRAFGDRLETKYRDQLEETARDYIDRMQVAAQRMQSLIDDLLSFSRISRGTDTYSEVDLEEIVELVREDMEVNLQATDARFEISSLPTVNGDEFQLKRLFQNLISNAIKFRQEGRAPLIQISSLKVKRENIEKGLGVTSPLLEYYRISVKDNGIGFDEKYAPKVFVIFQRLHAKTDYEGTGIGLAVCRKIVSNHNGFISVKSQPGEGSEFIIYLPETRETRMKQTLNHE